MSSTKNNISTISETEETINTLLNSNWSGTIVNAHSRELSEYQIHPTVSYHTTTVINTTNPFELLNCLKQGISDTYESSNIQQHFLVIVQPEQYDETILEALIQEAPEKQFTLILAGS